MKIKFHRRKCLTLEGEWEEVECFKMWDMGRCGGAVCMSCHLKPLHFERTKVRKSDGCCSLC